MCFGSGTSGSFAPTTQTTVQNQSQTYTPSTQATGMYNAAWQQAQAAAGTPFQQYSTDPNAFVAPLNPLQQQAIGGLGGISQAGLPYFAAAPSLAYGAGTTSAAGLAPQYMNPFMQQVTSPVVQALQQQQGQQQAQQQADQIRQSAFGQERGNLQNAVLAGQQNLALGQTLSPLYQNAYTTALGAAQTDLQRQLAAGQALSPMGINALQATLQGGTLGQQTQQAGLSSLYNQFLMQQAYPFLSSQFLTSAAAGLGPGYGGTTTGTSTGYQQSQTPLSFFGNPLSDPDLKVGPEGEGTKPEPVGKTHDGQTIYRYRVVNPDTGEMGPVQIGLMADEAGERKPEAVGDYKGYKTLDYEKATDEAARMGGGVTEPGDYNHGGRIHKQGGGPGLGGMYGQSGLPYGVEGYVPEAQINPIKTPDMPAMSSLPAMNTPKGSDQSLIQQGLGLYNTGKELYGAGQTAQKGLGALSNLFGGSGAASEIGGMGANAAADAGAVAGGSGIMDTIMSGLTALLAFKDGGGVRPHAQGGLGINPGATEAPDDLPDDTSVDEAPSSFEKNYQRTLRFEGGLNPNDAGRGPSMRGINQAAHPGIDVTKLTEPQTRDIYRKEYWQGVGADRLPENIRDMVFDTAVMAGPRRAKQLLSVAGTDPEAYMNAREKFLNNLVTNDPERFGKYAKSWANRNAELRGNAGLGDALANLPEGARNWQASAEGKTVDLNRAEPEGISGFLRGRPAQGAGEKALDFATSERFLIPLLTGLGGMASSGSRFLGPSILQGVGAGAKSYADFAQQQFERQKMGEELGIRKGELGLRGRATDIAEREARIKERDFERKMRAAEAIAKSLSGSSESIPYGTPKPTVPTETQPAPSTGETPPKSLEEKLTTPMAPTAPTVPPPSSSFWADVNSQSNPHVLNAKADQFERAAIASSQAGDTEYAKSLLSSAQQYRNAAGSILKEGRVLTSEGVKLLPGFAESAAALKKSEAQAEADVSVPTQAKLEEQKAEIGRKYAPVVSTTGTEYMPPVEGTPAPTAPVAPTETPSPAPGALPPDVGPVKAVVEPKTGALATAIPKAPPGGGMQIDPSVPAGAKISKLSPQNAAIVAEDQKFFGDFVEKQPNIDIAIQRFNSMAKAFKMVQSGATEDRLGALAAIADTYGYKDLARKIAAGEPSAVEWINKNGVNLVLDTLKAATPRFAQQEFTRIADQGVPSAERLPDTNFKMVSEGMGALERQRAFAQDWAKAKQQGWASPSAFWTEWSQSNPIEAFVASAERRLGNFKGMPLPPSDKWAEGAIYVVPKGLVGQQARALQARGLKPGDTFQFNGWQSPQALTPIPVEEVGRARYGAQ